MYVVCIVALLVTFSVVTMVEWIKRTFIKALDTQIIIKSVGIETGFFASLACVIEEK